MNEYFYRNFKVVYQIHPPKSPGELYKADGYATCSTANHTEKPSKFYTEFNTLPGVIQEIRKLLEEYIDFEWEEFQAIHQSK